MCRGDFFLKNNEHADPNKAVQGGIFSKINKRACMSIRLARVFEDFKFKILEGSEQY